MVDMKIKTDAKEVSNNILATQKSLTPTVARVLLKAGYFVKGYIQRFLKANSKNGKGTLGRSFIVSFGRQDKDVTSVKVLSDSIYANIQDAGGTVTPKTVQNLAIPLTPKASKLWPRNWPKGILFGYLNKNKNYFLATKEGNKLVNQYILKKSVTIKGKNYLEQASKQAMPDVIQILGRNIDASLLRLTKVNTSR